MMVGSEFAYHTNRSINMINLTISQSYSGVHAQCLQMSESFAGQEGLCIFVDLFANGGDPFGKK